MTRKPRKSFSCPEISITEMEDGSYLAEIRRLPGCVTDGQTREESLSNALEAAQGWMQTFHDLLSEEVSAAMNPATEDGAEV